MPWSPRAARAAERRAALTLLYRYLPDDERVRRVEGVRAMLDRGEIPAASLAVAARGKAVHGAVLAVPAAGACGLLSPPQVEPADDAVADRLVEHALAWLHRQGIDLVEALADPRDAGHFASLLRHGFLQPCRLWYLQHFLQPLPMRDPGEPPFVLRPSAEVGDRLGAALLASYERTLDFPELAGRRSLADILAGHRAGVAFDPRHWWLVEHAGRDAGVVLVGAMPEAGEWDLSYLGLVPAARGRGLGRAVVGEVLRRARQAGVRRVVLGVDERNAPALRLYRAVGFLDDEARVVFLKLGTASE